MSKSLKAFFIFALFLSLFLPFANAQDDASSSAETKKSLFERLGGTPAITAVVDDFVNRAAADPKVNFTRQGVMEKPWDATPEHVALLKQRLVQFISVATGDPNGNYEGKDMKTAHEGMKITSAEFDALAADLVAALQKFNVPEQEQKELLDIVGTTRGVIVEQA